MGLRNIGELEVFLRENVEALRQEKQQMEQNWEQLSKNIANHEAIIAKWEAFFVDEDKNKTETLKRN